MKAPRTILVLSILVLLYSVARAQTPTCNVYCKNIVQLTSSSFQFDITIMRTGGTAFNYTKGQYALSYNTAIRPNGTEGTWTLIITASDLPTAKQSTITVNSTNANGVFTLFAKVDDLDDYFVSNASEVLVARVTATLSVPFETQPLNFVWRTNTPNPYTKLYYNASGTSTVLPVGNLSYSMTGGDIGLPVELTSFNAITQGREVNLNWSTKTEVNSYIFEIERQHVSTNQTGEWEKVGSITASGNSNSPKEYSYKDTKLNSGNYSYRLKMIDNDGTYEYSEQIETQIELPREYGLSQNYPNAFNPSTKIDYQLPYDSKVTIELYGITGEKIATIINKEMSAGYYTAEINASALNLASGVYIYRMTAQNKSNTTNNSFTQVKKLMLTK